MEGRTIDKRAREDGAMKRFWLWLYDWWLVLFLLVFLFSVVYGVTRLVRYENQIASSERQDVCYSAGYDAVEFLDSLNRWGCLDVRDGQYVVVPIEDVRQGQ